MYIDEKKKKKGDRIGGLRDMTVGRWYCASTCIELSALVRRFDLFNQRCTSEPDVCTVEEEKEEEEVYT